MGFTYPGSTAPVLRDVDLSLARGETLVLIGATGSGKTTLLQLVPRLADTTSGRVLIGGTDVRDIPLAELRTAVGCAFEEATLFSASVRENVTFGAPDASDDEIEAALTAAQARFAYDLPWGLDTRIGEQGMALSGGQRQRVALARAILARPAGADPRRPAVGARRAHRGAGHPARSATCWPGPRRWSSRTGRPRSRSPTGSRCSTAG